ncbi:MAG: hypothetical protein GXO19_00630 [Epsilonproteobacteria bacterium]|nr:hypothetical protein [Campylobacterota bacterium]NPA56218.1 hypothetical protein [Campylobacterota bacterium]
MESRALLEREILALHFSGSYITNRELQRVGEKIGLQVDLTDRERLLKNLMAKARESRKESQLFLELARLFEERVASYRALKERYPEAGDIVEEYIEKSRRSGARLRREAQVSAYE